MRKLIPRTTGFSPKLWLVSFVNSYTDYHSEKRSWLVRGILSCAVFVLAFGVFSVSALQSTSSSRVFAVTLPTIKSTAVPTPFVNYTLLFPGKILPDNPLWTVKVMRDWIWYRLTNDPLKKAELALTFSDKRLVSSKLLFEAKKPDLAVSTYTKGEKYLEIAFQEEEIARKGGKDTSEFLTKLANASLKHRQITEEELLPIAPEDAKPEIIKVEIYAKDTYKHCRELLTSMGKVSPKDPFNGQ